MSDSNHKDNSELLAKGGGDATATGVRFQAALGAVFGAELLTERPMDSRLQLGDAKPLWIRFETEAPVDDILVATDAGGFVAVQAKASLQASTKPDSEFAKTVGQMARHYLACRKGDGGREWDRPLDLQRDRFLIAVGPKSSATIRQHLAEGLNARRQPGTGTIRPLSDLQKAALAVFDVSVRGVWSTVSSEPLTDAIISDLSRLTIVLTYDFDGADWTAASTVLGTALGTASEGERVLNLLLGISQTMMGTRSGVDEHSLRQRLARAGVKLQAPEAYRADVKALQTYSARVQEALAIYEKIEIEAGGTVNVQRICQDVVRDAALEGSLLLIGEPGAGKSAVINALGRDLRSRGYDVLELAVDRLPIESLEGLSRELGLQHSLQQVLGQWDGEQPGYVLIDALDATRGGGSEAVFRSLISELVSRVGRWRVVASIRTFDLRLGQQLRSLFKGKPPSESLADSSFPDVRHIQVPTWSPEELETLLDRAPALATALAKAGPKVRELALVPFNTRLIAELVVTGLESDKFSTIESQVELLRLYWRHRVEALGQAADVRLKRVVDLMVQARALRAPRIEAAEGDPSALQTLLQHGVLTVSSDDRYVSFRHHLLFDYAASRVYLDPDRLVAGTMAFPNSAALGLMLGPALGFVLRELWGLDKDHRRFWDAVIRLLRVGDCDPVMRSVAARAASVLPSESGDSLYWADQILAREAGVETTVVHVVGALAVRLEDNEPMVLAPWTAFAARLVPRIDAVAWPVRTLSYLLIERAKLPDDRVNLGAAARALLTFALSEERRTGLVDSAISFVADTYETDPDSSRTLLRRVFDDDRFAKYGPEEAPDLTRKIEVIATVDPDFAVEIYKEIYGRSVQDNRVTQMGPSQILSLTSNARQDFEMAWYALSEFFPKFLTSHPERAVDALVAAVKGYVTRKHALSEKAEERELVVAGQSVRLIDDLSCIWASDPDGEYREDAEVLIVAFRNHLLSADPHIAKLLAERVIRQNQLAVLWSRLFMVAAQRPDVLGELMWPFVSREPFLVSLDTRKDAIDVIVAMYAAKSNEDRRAFEVAALHFDDFSRFESPTEARDGFHNRLFSSIGADHLVTDEAKGHVPKDVVNRENNDRLFNFQISSGSPEPYWWFKKQNVDIDTPSNAELIKAIDVAKASLGLEKNDVQTRLQLADAMGVIRELTKAIAAAEAAHSAYELCGYATGILAECVEKAVSIKDLKEHGNRMLAFELADMVSRLAQSPFPQIDKDTESRFEKSPSWGSPAARVDAAQAALDLCLIDIALYKRLRPEIEQLITDKHPAVRLAAAKRLVRLWDTDRPGMWQLAEQVLREDKNLGVLEHFAISFLGTILHHDPVQVEHLTLQLLQRIASDDREIAKKFIHNLSSIVAILWASHGLTKAGEVLESWIKDPIAQKESLEKCLHALRGGLVIGYDDTAGREDDVRSRSQAVLAQCVDAAGQRLDDFFGMTQPNDKEQAEAQACAKLVDTACSQLFFASGAFKSSNDEDRGITPGSSRLRFANDVEPTLRRIGDVGTPHTIYNLLQLLEFLLPTDPPRIFDIMAHALLNGGRRHGYQYESLGSDLFVRIVGQCLADHQEIFANADRRQKLIACLETFMTAGWPSARRLLYRLPELLQ